MKETANEISVFVFCQDKQIPLVIRIFRSFMPLLQYINNYQASL